MSLEARVFMAGLALAISLAAVAPAFALDVKLDAEDQKVLKRIAAIEKAAGMSQTILAWAPLVSLVTSDGIAEFTFTFATNSWAEHAKAIGALEKIKSCSISEVIVSHLLDVTEPATVEFFEAIEKPYADKCST